MQDKLEKERNDAKNAVEEYVYDFRDKLGTVYEKFITNEVSPTFIIFMNYFWTVRTIQIMWINALNVLLSIFLRAFRNGSYFSNL